MFFIVVYPPVGPAKDQTIACHGLQYVRIVARTQVQSDRSGGKLGCTPPPWVARAHSLYSVNDNNIENVKQLRNASFAKVVNVWCSWFKKGKHGRNNFREKPQIITSHMYPCSPSFFPPQKRGKRLGHKGMKSSLLIASRACSNRSPVKPSARESRR